MYCNFTCCSSSICFGCFARFYEQNANFTTLKRISSAKPISFIGNACKFLSACVEIQAHLAVATDGGVDAIKITALNPYAEIAVHDVTLG